MIVGPPKADHEHYPESELEPPMDPSSISTLAVDDCIPTLKHPCMEHSAIHVPHVGGLNIFRTSWGPSVCKYIYIFHTCMEYWGKENNSHLALLSK